MQAPLFSFAKSKAADPSDDLSHLPIFSENAFLKMLNIEQRRTERSEVRFVLMLIQCANLLTNGNTRKALEEILDTLSKSIRVTDTMGWYEPKTTIGVIFTEIGSAEGKAVTSALLTKATRAFSSALSIEQINQIQISFHVFPEEWDGENRTARATLPAGAGSRGAPRKPGLRTKRIIDVAGSLFAIVLFSPLFALVALVIKLTSKGPVLYKQQRIGYHGRPFTFWKFRSMYTNSDPAIHEAFVQGLIRGEKAADCGEEKKQTVYKIARDPRVTPVGNFLRKTSLDELPQFFNVLRDEMSLVGPRPPIPYEVRCYHIWHRRRLLETKPGITGLWQVEGRSRVSFDDMVRLDLKYATSWSLWLDMKILLQTPRAVLSGAGAR